MKRELLRRIGIAVLVILILFGAAVTLFFAEGGEIRGINHDPDNPVISQGYQGFTFDVVEEEIVPIYDGTEIRTIELWQMPPKEILRHLVIAQMGHIPSITGYLITVFVSSLGLTFTILSERHISRINPEDGSRQEKILTHITTNPGQSIQQIASATEIPRSSLRHHLRKMQKKELIAQTDYCKSPHFFSREKSYTKTERLVLAILSREREKTVLIELFNHPGSTKRELGERLDVNAVTVKWYLNRFTEAKILTITADGVQSRYHLTDEAAEAYQKYLSPDVAAQ